MVELASNFVKYFGYCAEDLQTGHMHGGDLFIEFEKDGRIFMTGPVVYIGKITVAEQFFA